MKKMQNIALMVVFGLMFLLMGQTTPKKYRFEFDETQLNQLWFVIDNSSASHDVVKSVQATIQQQFQAQQPKADSLKTKK